MFQQTARKIVDLHSLPEWRAKRRAEGRRIVVTNGCFDILHAGHITCLEFARALGDVLLVGLNGDASVSALKGPSRPLQTEGDRARILAALECVDGVCIFPEARATRFLEKSEPDIYVKGGDYTLETLDTNERQVIEACGGVIEFFPMVPGRSTSNILGRI